MIRELILLLLMALAAFNNGRSPQWQFPTAPHSEPPRASELPVASELPDEAECPSVDDHTLTFEFDAEWQPGEVRHYEVRKYREDKGRTPELPPIQVATDVQITVLEATDAGFILEWVYGESRLIDSPSAQVAGMNELLEAPEGLRIEYETTKWGDFVQIRNLEEVQASVDTIIKTAFDAIIEEGGDKDAAEQAYQLVQQLLANLEQVELLYSRQIQMLHGIYGFYFNNRNLIRFDSVFPNILGGAPIPNITEIEITRFSNEQDCLHIDWTTQVDQEKARESIIEGLTKQAEQFGIEPPKGDEFPSEFGFDDVITMDFAIASHWPTYLEFERTIKVGPAQRTDRTTFIAKNLP